MGFRGPLPDGDHGAGRPNVAMLGPMDALGFDTHLYDVLPDRWRRLLFRETDLTEEERAAHAPAFAPELIDRMLPWIEPLYRYYFRCELRGIEKFPEDPPTFCVANHNALGSVEIPMLLYAWTRHFGHERPVHGLAHRMVFQVPLVRELLPRIGALPAAPEVARRTLTAGKDLLVFPGGDWEAARPFGDRKKIDFAGRHGFVRIALETGVPLVPIVICGAAETMLIFSRGERLAKALGIDKSLRMKVLPVTPQGIFALWKMLQTLRGRASPLLLPLWIANAWLGFPWLPSKIVFEGLDPIDLRAEVGDIEDEQARLQAGYDLVTSRMQAKMDELQAERRTFLG